MKRVLNLVLLVFVVPISLIQAAELELLSPLEYQVVQRQTAGGGTIHVRGLLSEDAPHDSFLEARLSLEGESLAWQRIDSIIAGRDVTGFLQAAAGGWKKLEVRVATDQAEFARASVTHVGIGEIFVIAGQSNSANYGEEKLTLQSDRVVAFDGSQWQIANDPQPRAKGKSGSFVPAFGDALVAKLNVPIGIVACGIGGTSVREWLPQGAQFPNPPTIESRVEQDPSGQWTSKGEAFDTLVSQMQELGPHGFRAVLWHQGESDANQKDPSRTLPGRLYREYLEKIIRDSRRAIGWDAPWIVAQTTYHVPGDESSPDIRAAQASLWKDGVAGEGPDTDTLKGDLRERNGQGVHFSAKGLRVHGQMWAEKVSAWLDQSAPTGVTVHSDFEGGSAEVVRVEQAAQAVRIMPALIEGRGWPCWWSIKVAGLKPGSQLSLEVQAQTRAYRPKTILAQSWCQPKHVWWSEDGGVTWAASPAGRLNSEKVMLYQIPVTGSELHVAWGPPFVATDAANLLQQIAQRLPESQPFELTKTRGGRSVNGIRIGSENARYQVWVNARHHAWETGGSQVGRGFIEWIASDDPVALAVRQQACIYFIPIMDVDNVVLGAGGKDAQPRDHNRDWADEPIYPEIAAAQKKIRAIHEQHGLDVYIDLHNPGANDPVYFYGPFGYEELQGTPRRNYQRWLELAARNIRQPVPLTPEYRFASYVTTEEERGRMSSGWVRKCIGETGISLTLETGWNHPEMSVPGYGSIGAGLGRTLAEYLSGLEK
jgi:hypothetical protein